MYSENVAEAARQYFSKFAHCGNLLDPDVCEARRHLFSCLVDVDGKDKVVEPTYVPENINSKLNKLEYLIEATHQEQCGVWEDWVCNWKVINNEDWHSHIGYTVTVGHLGDRPVVLTVWFHTIKGAEIGFYESNSEVVDWKMIEEFLDKQCPGVPRTDATNSKRALRYVTDKNRNSV